MSAGPRLIGPWRWAERGGTHRPYRWRDKSQKTVELCEKPNFLFLDHNKVLFGLIRAVLGEPEECLNDCLNVLFC